MRKFFIIFILGMVFNFSYGAEKILNEEENAIIYNNIYKINEDGEMISCELVEDIFQDIIFHTAKSAKEGQVYRELMNEMYGKIYHKVVKWEKQKNGLFYAKKLTAYNMLEYYSDSKKSDSSWYKNSKWKYAPGENIYKRECDIKGHGVRLSITEKNKLTSEDVEKLQIFIGNMDLAEVIYFIIPLVKDKNDNVLQYGMAELY